MSIRTIELFSDPGMPDYCAKRELTKTNAYDVIIIMNKKTKALVPKNKANRGKVAPYVKKALAEVDGWENEKPGFLNQVADFIFWPAEKAAEALIPESVNDAVGKAIEQALVPDCVSNQPDVRY